MVFQWSVKKGGMALKEWLVRLLNVSFDMVLVPLDWLGACIVPLHNGKGDNCICSNSIGISLLSVVDKLYGKSVDKGVTAGTEHAIVEEKCGFRQGNDCMEQVFAVSQVFEKYLTNGKVVFSAFIDLEKDYDTIDRHSMWQMQRLLYVWC